MNRNRQCEILLVCGKGKVLDMLPQSQGTCKNGYTM